MNCDVFNHRLPPYVFLILMVCWFGNCQSIDDIPSPSTISKAQRTALGASMQTVILDEVLLNVLPKGLNSPYKPTYDFLQQLYNQAYYFIRDDWSAPDNDKWDASRLWEMSIFQSDEKLAFCLPGGNFFVSTALLKSLELESELYYIMTFEVMIMHDRYLLNQLVSYANNAADLMAIIEDGQSMNQKSIEDLTFNLLEDVNYREDGIVKNVDEATSERICESSVFDRLAIVSALTSLGEGAAWTTSRPSYPNRKQFLNEEMLMTNNPNCGDKQWINNKIDYTNYMALLP